MPSMPYTSACVMFCSARPEETFTQTSPATSPVAGSRIGALAESQRPHWSVRTSGLDYSSFALILCPPGYL